jgi:mRNA interferase MazF
VKQFEIWWADMPPPVGRRPVVILTRTEALRYLSKCIVAEVTATIRDIAVEVPLGPDDGLARPCVANLDNVHVIPLRRLSSRAGALAPTRHAEVKRALGHALDWPELLGA